MVVGSGWPGSHSTAFLVARPACASHLLSPRPFPTRGTRHRPPRWTKARCVADPLSPWAWRSGAGSARCRAPPGWAPRRGLARNAAHDAGLAVKPRHGRCGHVRSERAARGGGSPPAATEVTHVASEGFVPCSRCFCPVSFVFQPSRRLGARRHLVPDLVNRTFGPLRPCLVLRQPGESHDHRRWGGWER